MQFRTIKVLRHGTHYRIRHVLRWTTVTSRVSRVRIIRIRPDGTSKQVVVSQVAYAFAHLNPLSDGGVVFSDIPTVANLWQHRSRGLTVAQAAKYGPVIKIELAYAGEKPRVLVAHGRLPALQP
jgi:hypothetical protein